MVKIIILFLYSYHKNTIVRNTFNLNPSTRLQKAK